MKNIITLSLLFLFFSYNGVFARLSSREKLFLAQHRAPVYVRKKLNLIFNSLNQELRALLSGEETKKSRQEMLALFRQAGFHVYVLVAKNISRKNNLHCWFHVVLRHQRLPRFFLKIGFDEKFPHVTIMRILFADFINAMVDASFLGITKLGKIEKKIYHIPGRPTVLRDVNYVVLSPYVEGKILGKLNYAHKSIYTDEECKKNFEIFLLSTDFLLVRMLMNDSWDYFAHNLVLRDDGRLVPIDTEPGFRDVRKEDGFSKLLARHLLGWE